MHHEAWAGGGDFYEPVEFEQHIQQEYLNMEQQITQEMAHMEVEDGPWWDVLSHEAIHVTIGVVGAPVVVGLLAWAIATRGKRMFKNWWKRD